ncbi:MAG: hypothetical protein KDC14_07400 [Planctomycetes bacterium]|nr:hypothetical protein [Planctomycetota bacterium]
MKHRSTAALSVGLFLLVMGGTVQSAQEKQTLEARVQQLEFQTSADTATIQTLLGDVQTLQAKQAKVESYLVAQAEEAERMARVLDDAEAKGYTQGINYPAREALLAGWRAQIATQRANVPGSEKKPAAPTQGRRASR